MKNNFLMVVIVLIVLFIAIAIGVGLNLGPIVKLGIEQVGPKITQVSIKVDAVDVSLLTGSAKLKGLVVGNPSGYTMPQAFSVGTVSVSMNPTSVMSPKIMIHSVQVESPEITFEGGLSNNNLTKISDNVNRASKNPTAENSTASGGNKPAPKIEIDDFLITGAKVHIKVSGLGNKDISLPDIHLTDLGKGSDGLTPTELTRVLLNSITTETIKTVSSSLSDLTKSVANLGKGAGQTVGQSLSKISGSLGGLFGK